MHRPAYNAGMRALVVQHLPTVAEPLFVGRTLDGSFHVVWRQEILASAASLQGAITLACKGPLQHAEVGLLPPPSPLLEDWLLCSGQDIAGPVRLGRRPRPPEFATPQAQPLHRDSSPAERLARVQRAAAAKAREEG